MCVRISTQRGKTIKYSRPTNKGGHAWWEGGALIPINWNIPEDWTNERLLEECLEVEKIHRWGGAPHTQVRERLEEKMARGREMIADPNVYTCAVKQRVGKCECNTVVYCELHGHVGWCPCQNKPTQLGDK